VIQVVMICLKIQNFCSTILRWNCSAKPLLALHGLCASDAEVEASCRALIPVYWTTSSCQLNRSWIVQGGGDSRWYTGRNVTNNTFLTADRSLSFMELSMIQGCYIPVGSHFARFWCLPSSCARLSLHCVQWVLCRMVPVKFMVV
jgi:hypothetical protein